MGNPVSTGYKHYLAAQLPAYAAELIEAIETTDPSVAVRLNPRKCQAGALLGVAAGATESVPWCEEGRYFSVRPDFTHDPAMHQGLYYVQDASSMAIGRIIGLLTAGDTAPVTYLDACAAPGGKTTAAIDALPEGSLVVANEYDYRRAEILRENVMKWGYAHVAVSRGDTALFRRLTGMFGIIAADVPCSGEGMMRKDPKAAAQWSEALVRQCVERQREILDNLWEALRPGGYLIYSTCTFNTAENEQQLAWLTERYGAEPVELPADLFPGAVKPGSMLRFLPGRVRGEGLAIGVVRKPADDAPQPATPPKSRAAKPSKIILPAGIDSLLTIDAEISAAPDGETLRAVAREHAATVALLGRQLQLIHAGVELGTLKGRKFVPSQGLALSTALRRGAFPEAEVDTATALAYLRREALGGFDAPRGSLLLTHAGAPLGFVNHLGNRSNNLYPAPWRILT